MPDTIILNSLAEAGIDTGRDVILKLIMFFIVAVILFVVSYLSQTRKGGRHKWMKYVFGLLPVAAGIGMMMDYFRYATNAFNVSALGMNSNQVGIYKAAPFICLGFGVILAIIGVFLDRSTHGRVEDIL